jgi:heptosyltransferase I
MINSICLVRLSALGDVLMLVPLIRRLQAHLPKASITWVISRPAYDLVEGMQGVEFIVIDKPQNLTDYWRFRQRMRDRHFDVLLATQASLRTNLLYPLISASRKIGYDKHRGNDGHGLFVKERIGKACEHTLEGFLHFAKPLGITDSIVVWDMPIGEADYAFAAAHMPKRGPVLVVNPAASKPERTWMLGRYITVLKQARERWQLEIVLTGGPGSQDKMLGEAIEAALPVTNLIGKTKPKQLLALISKAQAVLCPDTGPSHMAAAVNTPVVALHAVTNPLISGPYTSQAHVVNAYPMALGTVLGLPSAPWGTQVHKGEAMQLISVEAVMDKLAGIFDDTSR